MMNCNSCGAPLKDGDPVCASCGAATSGVSQPKPTASVVTSELSEYYRSEFQNIRDSNEQYKGKWNWAAFWGGPIWAFTKGLKEVIVIYALAILFTFGISVLVYAVIFGLRGNYFYYTKLMKGRVLLI
jgi:zinc ribbon protein